MSEKGRQFLRVFDHVYSQWFSVPGREAPEDNKPLTDEEMDLAAEISDYCEELFNQIIDEQNAKRQGQEAGSSEREMSHTTQDTIREEKANVAELLT